MGENLEALAKAIYARHPYRNLRGDIISWDRIAQSTHEDANGYEIHDLDVPFYVGTIRALLDFLGFDPQNPPAEGIGAELRARAEAAEARLEAAEQAVGECAMYMTHQLFRCPVVERLAAREALGEDAREVA